MLKSKSVNPDFFDRSQELEQLHKILDPRQQESPNDEMIILRSFVLCGYGGIGKTQISVQYAYSSIHQYDAIFLGSS